MKEIIKECIDLEKKLEQRELELNEIMIERNNLLDRIDKVIKDLELTKEKNIPFLDEYGNALIYIDVGHIDYLIKILRGEDNDN